MTPHIEFDKRADAIYIYFSDKPVAYTKKLDDIRYIDCASDDTPVGVELLCVSDGVDMHDLPQSEEISRLLGDKNIKIFA